MNLSLRPVEFLRTFLFKTMLTAVMLSSILTITSFGKMPDSIHSNTPVLSGVSSWYGHEMGKVAADGSPFRPEELTIAHRSLPFGTVLRMTNPENGKVILVKVTDRGPFIKKHGLYTREFDVSEGCAIALGFKRKGVTNLVAEVLKYGEPKFWHRAHKVHKFIGPVNPYSGSCEVVAHPFDIETTGSWTPQELQINITL